MSKTFQRLDINNWARKEHYHFFKNFDDPFFGVTVDVDCTQAYQFCQENQLSFFLFYLHKSLIAANLTREFKFRIVDDEVLEFEQINGSSTVNRANGTFGFCEIPYHQDFTLFTKTAKIEIEKVQQEQGLIPSDKHNTIYFSSLPWINFTSLTHAKNYSANNSCPKISFGQMTKQNDQKKMPVSIHVHHALMDGLHVGEYIQAFQQAMNPPYS